MILFPTSGARILRYAFSALWRNKMTAVFSMIALSLLFLLVHISSFAGQISASMIQNFEKKVDITVLMKTTSSKLQAEAFRNDLEYKKSRGEIVDYWVLSREDALDEFRRNYPEPTQFLERYRLENPLSTVFGIIPQPTKTSTYELERWILSDQWHDVVDQAAFRKNTTDRARVQKILDVMEMSQVFIVLFEFLFFAIAFALMMYFVMVMIRTHRREIAIMRLVGARYSFIRGPFLVEAVILASSAFVLSMLLFNWFLSGFQVGLSKMTASLHLSGSYLSQVLSDREFFLNLLLDNSIIMVIVSLVAALFAIQRALRQNLFSDF